jgi:hypothetical protein
VRDHRPVAAPVRRPQIAALERILVVVVEIPELPRQNRLLAASASRVPRCDDRRVLRPYQPMRPAIPTFHFGLRKSSGRETDLCCDKASIERMRAAMRDVADELGPIRSLIATIVPGTQTRSQPP